MLKIVKNVYRFITFTFEFVWEVEKERVWVDIFYRFSHRSYTYDNLYDDNDDDDGLNCWIVNWPHKHKINE